MSNEIDAAIAFFDGLNNLAMAVGESPQVVANWRRRGCPAAKCPVVERVADGWIKCEDLRPDITWVRIPDPSWPWHPDGRPLVDVATSRGEEPAEAKAG